MIGASPGPAEPAGAEPTLPRYGRGSLAELVPSVLAALGVDRFANPLALEPMPGACVVVIDAWPVSTWLTMPARSVAYSIAWRMRLS